MTELDERANENKLENRISIFPPPCGARKNTTQHAKYPHVLYLFCILINVYSVMYYNFLHTDLYERVGKIKKEKKTKHIYIVHTHTHTHITR